MMRMSVDLPAPFSPRTARTFPGSTERLTPSLARTPGYVLVMLTSRSRAVMGENLFVGGLWRPKQNCRDCSAAKLYYRADSLRAIFSRLPGRLRERRSTLQHAKYHHFLALLKNLSKMRSPVSDDGHKCAPVAQLDRVPGYEPGGRGFESYPAHQKFLRTVK